MSGFTWPAGRPVRGCRKPPRRGKTVVKSSRRCRGDRCPGATCSSGAFHGRRLLAPIRGLNPFVSSVYATSSSDIPTGIPASPLAGREAVYAADAAVRRAAAAASLRTLIAGADGRSRTRRRSR